MACRRLIGIACGFIVATLIVLPALAVPISAVVDRGTDGSPRLTAFHLALTLSDDSAVEMVRNSLVLALVVAALAMLLGVGLGRLAVGGRSFGRDGLLALAQAPGAYPPLIGALGLIGIARLIPSELAPSWRWVALGWVELAWAVPRVMAAHVSAFAAVDATWIDAARVAGAKKHRSLGVVGWPLAKGHVARSLAEVFAFTLFEPGAPLVLGLRRTLPVGLIEAAVGLDREPRAAVLGVIGLGLAFVARALILAWGGPLRSIPIARAGLTRSPRVPMWRLVPLAAWVMFALLPIVGLAASALGLDRSGRFRLDGLLALATDAESIRALLHGAVLGLAASSFAVLIAWGMRASRPRASWRDPAAWPAIVPPLAMGLGVFLLPGLLDSAATLATSRAGPIAAMCRWLADLLDPYRSPWLVLIAATAMLRLPSLRTAIDEIGARDDRDVVDVARTLGASRWQAWTTAAAPAVSAILAGAIAVAVARSALDAGPSLLLARTTTAQPVGPAIVGMVAEPDGPRRAAGLAFAALIFPVAAWIVGGLRRSARTRLVEDRADSLS
jgi:iron(III) transport system permease protein